MYGLQVSGETQERPGSSLSPKRRSQRSEVLTLGIRMRGYFGGNNQDTRKHPLSQRPLPTTHVSQLLPQLPRLPQRASEMLEKGLTQTFQVQTELDGMSGAEAPHFLHLRLGLLSPGVSADFWLPSGDSGYTCIGSRDTAVARNTWTICLRPRFQFLHFLYSTCLMVSVDPEVTQALKVWP